MRQTKGPGLCTHLDFKRNRCATPGSFLMFPLSATLTMREIELARGKRCEFFDYLETKKYKREVFHVRVFLQGGQCTRAMRVVQECQGGSVTSRKDALLCADQ